jgi:hypothetical protein
VLDRLPLGAGHFRILMPIQPEGKPFVERTVPEARSRRDFWAFRRSDDRSGAELARSRSPTCRNYSRNFVMWRRKPSQAPTMWWGRFDLPT